MSALHTEHPAYVPRSAIPTAVHGEVADTLKCLNDDWFDCLEATWRSRPARLGLMLVHLADATAELETLAERHARGEWEASS